MSRDIDDTQRLALLVHDAQAGDARALEQVVVAVRDRVYRLSLRMSACPVDAEDATQEILIRMVTQLGSYRGEAAFSTWVHRIAVNRLMDRNKSVVERERMSFDSFAADLLDGLAASPSSSPDARVLEREVQLACTHAMLTCLDREHRIAYIVGEIFEVDSDTGGYICDVSPATYRKRLSRARSKVRGFLGQHCGLVGEAAACRCSRRVDAAVALGRADRACLRFTDRTEETNSEMVRFHDAAALLRSLPQAIVPEATADVVARLVRESAPANF